jgi:DNA-binding transcriptional ArsR family regulator
MTDLNPQPDFVPADTYVVDDLDTLKVLADPLRLRIREFMQSPTTVKQVAAELDMPPTKLYYHINLLEKHGLIVLVDTQVVSGIIEKHYQVAARHVRVQKNLLSSADESLSLTVNAVFENVREALLQSARAGVVDFEKDDNAQKRLSMRSSVVYLTDEQAAELYDALETLLSGYADISDDQHNHPDARPYQLLTALFPKTRRDNQSNSS